MLWLCLQYKIIENWNDSLMKLNIFQTLSGEACCCAHTTTHAQNCLDV